MCAGQTKDDALLCERLCGASDGSVASVLPPLDIAEVLLWAKKLLLFKLDYFT